MAPKFCGVLLDFIAPTQVTPALNFTPEINSYKSELQGIFHYGDYTSDLAKGRYNKQWDSLVDMEYEEVRFIELRLKDTLQGTAGEGEGEGWIEKSVYVCMFMSGDWKDEDICYDFPIIPIILFHFISFCNII